MEATIDISYKQIYNLITQLPVRYRLRLGKELTTNATEMELRRFLDIFATDEISEDDILSEVKAIRHIRYANKIKEKSDC